MLEINKYFKISLSTKVHYIVSYDYYSFFFVCNSISNLTNLQFNFNTINKLFTKS